MYDRYIRVHLLTVRITEYMYYLVKQKVINKIVKIKN